MANEKINSIDDCQFARIVNADDNQTVDMYLYASIGRAYDGVDAERFANELAWLSRWCKKINVHINSGGGQVMDGWGIYSAIQNINLNVKGVTVDTYCDGLCASIAAIILLAGKKVYMNDFAKIMVHKAYVPGMNDTNLTEKQKQALAEINDTTTQIMTKRTGLSAEEVTTMLEKDTYFNAQDAKAKGFIDEIIATPQKNKVVEASQNLGIYDPEFLYALYQSVLPLPEKETPKPPKKQPTQNMEPKKEENALIAMLMESLEVADEKDILQKINLLKASKMKADLLENELLTIKEQNQKMANQIAEQANQQAEILVEDAIKAGKIRPMQKESFIKMAKHDYQMAKEAIDSMNGHPNLAQKVKQEDERANWSLKDWAKKDAQGLKYIREHNWEQYSEIYEKEYGQKPIQIFSNAK